MELHRMPFHYNGPEDDQAIELVIIGNYRDIITFEMFSLQAFSKKHVKDRKKWLRTWLEERDKRAEGLDEVILIIINLIMIRRYLVLFQ